MYPHHFLLLLFVEAINPIEYLFASGLHNIYWYANESCLQHFYFVYFTNNNKKIMNLWLV